MLNGRDRDAKRISDRLNALYAIGGGPGANRAGLSGAEQEACNLVSAWMEADGLQTGRDPAGNVFGRLAGTSPDESEVWTGSHLDSVPAGGRFDGALGVVLGLEAVRVAAESGRPGKPLVVVVFRDEEGWRFPGRGCFGSRALCGGLRPDELDGRDAEGVSVREALAELGLSSPPALGWLEQPPAAFVEAHVEQGPVLARSGAPLGIVTGIAGIARFTVGFEGLSGHAGTMPMAGRADALCAAADYVLRVRLAAEEIQGSVATVGRLVVEPGAPNVIPGRVSLTVDARAPDRARLEALLEAVEAPAETHASDPVRMADHPRAALRAEIERMGLPLLELPSGAGHDAGILAAAGVPSAMLFVRSLAGGASHSPAEETSDEDIMLALDVLAGALRRLSV